MTDAVAVTPAVEGEQRRRWRLPAAWRERSDWVAPETTLGRTLRGLRWATVAAYCAFLIDNWHTHGVPLDRDRLLLSIALGLGCLSIGRHPASLAWVIIDFVPFALVLVAYDYLRGVSDTVGMPTWWHPQLAMDRFLFFGHEPTIWLQEHLKHAANDVRWYDLVVCLAYLSFFFLPYLTAGVMWFRNRADFQRWALRFVGLSFLCFLLFLLSPAAPPWAAALCTAKDVAGHPHYPLCMRYPAHAVPGNLLGPYTVHLSGAHPYVERIGLASFYKLHLGVAHTLWTKGWSVGDAVAAVPSLHMGGTVLFSLFLWSRLRVGWRPLLVAYPLLMQFSLTYSGEHYVVDGIAGALCAWLVHWAATRVESRRRARLAGRGRQALPTDSVIRSQVRSAP